MVRFIPFFVLSEHCVQDSQQLAHTGNQRHFFGFSGCKQTHVKRLYHQIKPGCHKSSHVQGCSCPRSTAKMVRRPRMVPESRFTGATPISALIDEHSDYALALAVPSLNSDIVNHFFSRAARLFPVGISQIITDNGKEFPGSFDKTRQEAAIKHLWTYPYTPKMNAICERFNRTLREQFIEFNEILLFEDLALFNQKLAEYLVLYNSKRPHKALALMTPVEYILKENKNCNMW